MRYKIYLMKLRIRQLDNKNLLQTDFEIPYHMGAKASDHTLRQFDTQRHSI